MGLTLETDHFEDYLSFLTEVLELDLAHLTDDSMVLHLGPSVLEIRRGEKESSQKNTVIRFALNPDDFESLTRKISFFSYRKGGLTFEIDELLSDSCQLIDPDGRAWCFSLSSPANRGESVVIL